MARGPRRGSQALGPPGVEVLTSREDLSAIVRTSRLSTKHCYSEELGDRISSCFIKIWGLRMAWTYTSSSCLNTMSSSGGVLMERSSREAELRRSSKCRCPHWSTREGRGWGRVARGEAGGEARRKGLWAGACASVVLHFCRDVNSRRSVLVF